MMQQGGLVCLTVVGLRRGCWILMVLALSFGGGCARVTPGPDVLPSDLQITADSLKTAVREAQRTASELRAELEEQRKDLADAHVARAQLQGMLRETERRLADARQVIELQREELASARSEREKVAQMEPPMSGRSRLPMTGTPSEEQSPVADPEAMGPALDRERDRSGDGPHTDEAAGAHPAALVPGDERRSERPASAQSAASIRTIVIQAGDTLWRIARRHKVQLNALRAINGLQNNIIVVGRTLRLPEPRLQQATLQSVSRDTLVQ